MTDTDNFYDKFNVNDFIDHTIIPDPDAIAVIRTNELPCPRWTGILL